MGIQLWGAFGGFQKKTGALVGRWLKGQNVITAIPHPSKKPPTAAQLDYRAKFGLIVTFLRPISQILKIGFRNAHAEKQTAWNAAFVQNYKNAITGTGPTFTVDYKKIVLSKGFLSPIYDSSVGTGIPETLDLTWSSYFTVGSGAPTDMLTIVVYNPSKGKYVYVSNAAPRSALAYDMLVPVDYKDDYVHCYLFFISADGKVASDTLHHGPIRVL